MKDSISDSVAPVDPNATPTQEWWIRGARDVDMETPKPALGSGTEYRLSKEEFECLGYFGSIELPPEPTWTCELYGTGKEQIWYTSRAPNWFWRLMQRLILGNHWKKL